MKLTIRREGGFFPQVLEKTINVGDLPEGLRVKFLDYFGTRHRFPTPASNLRDSYNYHFEWDGEIKGMVMFDESTLPTFLRQICEVAFGTE